MARKHIQDKYEKLKKKGKLFELVLDRKGKTYFNQYFISPKTEKDVSIAAQEIATGRKPDKAKTLPYVCDFTDLFQREGWLEIVRQKRKYIVKGKVKERIVTAYYANLKPIFQYFHTYYPELSERREEISSEGKRDPSRGNLFLELIFREPLVRAYALSNDENIIIGYKKVLRDYQHFKLILEIIDKLTPNKYFPSIQKAEEAIKRGEYTLFHEYNEDDKKDIYHHFMSMARMEQDIFLTEEAQKRWWKNANKQFLEEEKIDISTFKKKLDSYLEKIKTHLIEQKQEAKQ